MRHALLALAFLGFAACSGSRSASTYESTPQGPSMAEILQELSRYEEFDLSAYPNELIETEVEVEHLVPAELMENRATGRAGGQQRGYRIQLVFAREKETADQSVQEVLQWWRNQQASRPNDPLFRGDLPVHNIYQQPYYRVRIGDFANRADAESLLRLVQGDYPRAFIVVDTIGQD